MWAKDKTTISLLTAASLFFLWSTYLTTHRVDDVYIFYRYAENLASGHGLVYNLGQKVEGITSLLWTFILAFFSLIGANLEASAPKISLLCAALSLPLLIAIARKIMPDLSNFHIFLLVTLVASHPSFAYWAYSGMETSLYTLLILSTLYYYLKERQENNFTTTSLLAALTILCRPEMLVICFAFAFDLLFSNQKRKFAKILNSMVIITLALSLLLAARYFYYGEFLPNTYYAKSGFSFQQTYSNGFWYFFDFVENLVFIPIFGEALKTFALLSCLIAVFAYNFLHPSARPVALVLYFLCFVVIIEGGDWMIENRFLVPAIALTYLSLLLFLKDFSKKFKLRALTSTFLFLLILSNTARGIYERESGKLSKLNSSHKAYHSMANYLNQHAKRNEWIALMDIGQIGYETKLPIIDISGLTHKEIARAKGGFASKQYSPDLVLKQKPRYIFIRPGYVSDENLRLTKEFQINYKLVAEWDLTKLPSARTMLLYEREGKGMSLK